MNSWIRSLSTHLLQSQLGLKFELLSHFSNVSTTTYNLTSLRYHFDAIKQNFRSSSSHNNYQFQNVLRFPIGALVTGLGGYLQEPAFCEESGTQSASTSQEREFLSCFKQNNDLGVSIMYVLPLMQIVSGYTPSAQALDEGFQILQENINKLNISDLAIILWGCARMGYNINSDVYRDINAQVKSQISFGNATDLSALAFALSVMGLLDDETWSQITQKLNSFSTNEFKEVDLFHLAYVGMMRASESGSGSQVDPRPSPDEVKNALNTLYRRLSDQVSKKYKEYSPFHAYIDSVFMTISFMMIHLERFSHGQLPLVSPLIVKMTEETLSDSRRMGQLKRALFFHWRKDELLDPWQRDLNEIVFVIQRRMGEIVTQPQDADIVLPNRKIAVFLTDDSVPNIAQINIQQTGLAMIRYTSPDTIGGGDKFVVKENAGMKRAKIRQLQERGWKVLQINKSQWDGVQDLGRKEAFLRQAILEVEMGLR